mgnify:CR=1 FL=1
MAHEQQGEDKAAPVPSFAIRVTHIRDGQVIGVTETPIDELDLKMMEAGNGSDQ